MKIKPILSRVLALLPAASRDQSRDQICGVLIKSDDTSTTLVATNGHVLITETIDLPFLAGNYLVHYSSESMLNALLEGPERIAVTRLQDGILIGDQLYLQNSKSYPDYAAVIPEQKEGMVRIAFNADYMALIGNALAGDHSLPVVWIEFDPKDPKAAIRLKAPGINERLGVLMPCRADEVSSHTRGEGQ